MKEIENEYIQLKNEYNTYCDNRRKLNDIQTQKLTR